MQRMMVVIVAGAVLGGCGLGETAVSSAAGGAAELAQAKQGLKTEARVKQQLDAATALEAGRRQSAEAEAQ